MITIIDISDPLTQIILFAIGGALLIALMLVYQFAIKIRPGRFLKRITKKFGDKPFYYYEVSCVNFLAPKVDAAIAESKEKAYADIKETYQDRLAGPFTLFDVFASNTGNPMVWYATHHQTLRTMRSKAPYNVNLNALRTYTCDRNATELPIRNFFVMVPYQDPNNREEIDDIEDILLRAAYKTRL